MSLTNKIKDFEFPQIGDVLQSGKNAKNKMNNMNINKVMVHFYYADNRFKTTSEGTITHESEVPIVYLEYPEKLAFLVPENTLVYDVKNQCFEISVNEKYTHSIEIKNNIDADEVKKLLLPVFPDYLKYQVVEVEGIVDKEGENITLSSKMLSSLGRAKILERTLESSNDGLMIMGFIGLLIGFCIGIIVNIKGV